MLKDCLTRDYQSPGTNSCEGVFDSKETLGTAAVCKSWYLRITRRKAIFWRALRLPTAVLCLISDAERSWDGGAASFHG